MNKFKAIIAIIISDRWAVFVDKENKSDVEYKSSDFFFWTIFGDRSFNKKIEDVLGNL